MLVPIDLGKRLRNLTGAFGNKEAKMGGFGSTRWALHTRKQVADDALAFTPRQMLADPMLRVALTVHTSAQGWLGWYAGTRLSSAGYELRWVTGTPVLSLNGVAFELTTTPCAFGGSRWWFFCSCGRRVGKLYCPTNSSDFACRHCHGLTYRSAQTAHQVEQMGGAVGQALNHLDIVMRLQRLEGRYQRATGERRRAHWRAQIDKQMRRYGPIGNEVNNDER